MRAEADVINLHSKRWQRAEDVKENADKGKRSRPTEEDSEEPFLLLAVFLAIFLFMLFSWQLPKRLTIGRHHLGM